MKHSFLLIGTLLVASAAHADDTGLARCRSLTSDASRLACYDALPLPPSPAAQIGLETQRAAETPTIDTLISSIPGRFDGWEPRTRIRLANGQLWQVTDESTGVYRLQDAAVTIRRGMLGSFFLELPGVQRSVRVKRIE